MKTVIMAGGKGTRMASLAPGVPKPMIPVCGKPVLQYQLECLARNKLTDIIISIGYLGDQIKNFCGDGKQFGCNISYYEEEEPLGSGGVLFKIIEDLDDDFILINGDVIFDMDFSRFIDFYRSTGAWTALAVHPNSHPFDSALLFTDSEHRVIKWLNKEEPRHYYKNQVNAGIHILSKKLLRAVKPVSEKVDLDRDILKPLIPSGKIFAYPTPEYIKDAGTPDRFAQVSEDIKNGLVQRRNLSLKQKAVFLDRDGTINRLNGFISRPEDLILLDGAAQGIKEVNRLGYLAIVVTNQPIIARGEASLETLEEIHNKMETELGNYGAYLDDIFFCPHHPDKGFPGERPEYKIDCSCRKPKPGMFFTASEKFNIDLGQSYMAGDDKRDIEAALNAGCRPVFIGAPSELQLIQESTGIKNILCFRNLARFAESLQTLS